VFGRLEPRHAGHGNHGRIVGAKLDAWVEDLDALPRNRFRHSFTQAAVRSDTAGHHQRVVPGVLQRAQRLGDQSLDDGLLHARGDVRSRGLVQRTGRYVQGLHVLGEMDKTIACDISAARRDLGYDPQVELYEGMRRSIRWCLEQGMEL